MSEKLPEAIVDFANAVESACVNLKRYIGEVHGVGVQEETFTSLLGWSATKGDRIGDFEYCTRKSNNNSDAFNHAYNILKVNDANIKNQFSDEEYKYHYWIWPEGKSDTIYRKERKK